MWIESVAKRVMREGGRAHKLAFFCVRFAIFIPPLVILWWEFLPVYGYLLVQTAGSVLRYVLSVPIESGFIQAEGVFNTDSKLVFVVAGHERALPIALLVTNIPPYLALILATAGLGLWKRLRVLAYGSGILMLGHIAFLVIVLRFQETLQQASEVPTAAIQFFLTLPFLLWIVLAYWDRIGGARADGTDPAVETGEPEGAPGSE